MYKRRITRCFDCNKIVRPKHSHKLYYSTTLDGKDKPVVLCDDCFVLAGFYLKRYSPKQLESKSGLSDMKAIWESTAMKKVEELSAVLPMIDDPNFKILREPQPPPDIKDIFTMCEDVDTCMEGK